MALTAIAEIADRTSCGVIPDFLISKDLLEDLVPRSKMIFTSLRQTVTLISDFSFFSFSGARDSFVYQIRLYKNIVCEEEREREREKKRKGVKKKRGFFFLFVFFCFIESREKREGEKGRKKKKSESSFEICRPPVFQN